MDTLILERQGRLIFTNVAGVVKPADVAEELSNSVWEVDQESNPFVKWIAGDFVEADKPNSNTQFWTKGDLELAEYTIKYAPLNMLHKQRTPVGFYAATRKINLNREAAAEGGSMKIQALSGMWSHIFPFESNLIDSADATGNLFYSMECRGSHLKCGGPNGCGEQFAYMEPDTHCAHLKDRSSIRHIMNPVFRGGAIIIPPVRPGWKDARASVLEQSVKDEACKWAEQNETAYLQANSAGSDLSASAWEQLMAQIITFADRS